MAMQVGGDGGDQTPISEINTTPLVDVMLVLLIIFIITVPVVLNTIPVTLPQVEFEPTTTKAENVNLSIRAPGGQCEVYWEVTRVTSQELLDRGVAALREEIERQGGPDNVEELPEVHIRGDVNTPYRCIGGAIFTMQRAGFTRVGFISEPVPGGGG
ncbi:biopolymer transporter ExbD [Sphingosinicella sp. YJ22]|uniref:ExbD/TolR family protein n=1 Tax=Sphingosinicella sp. YJ22 TaxID=1104780 RepID=UPI00140C9184|nr:biopolymer transporter ExbD [Sphingosinicella sp. YJ22]